MNKVEIQKFFKQWHIYKSIIKNNYMCHDEIFSSFYNFFTNVEDEDLTVVEIGCGDAYYPSKIFPKVNIIKYIGIDMSKYALAEAKKNISNVNFSCEFICNDAMLELQNINEKYNIIVAGYMLQHLNDDQLTELLRNVYLKLKNRYGYVFWYDMFRNNNLELIEYRNIFHNEIYKNWNDLTMEERDITLDHTKNHDYIRSYEEVELYAKKAGFREVKKVYSSENGYYAAFILCK